MKHRCFLPLLFAAVFLSVVPAWSQKITVTRPAAPDIWLKGKTYIIEWTREGALPATVRIILTNTDESALIQVIADPALNSGTYSWTIPNSVANGPYKIKVRASNTEIVGTSAAFQVTSPGFGSRTVVPVAPAIEITRPAEKDSFVLGQTVRIHWNMRQPLGGSVRIILLNPAEAVIQTIAASAENKGAFDWEIPQNTPPGSYRIRVQVLGQEASAKSGLFGITERPVVPEKAVAVAEEFEKTQAVAGIFRVISPTQNQVIKPPKEMIHAVWETVYPPPFDVVLLRHVPGSDAIVEAKSLIRGYDSNPQSSSGNLKRYGCDFIVDLDDPAVPDGWYKVKISTGDGPSAAHTLSPSFRIERGTAFKQIVLEPDETLDRMTDWTIKYTSSHDATSPGGARWNHMSKPGLARVGYCYVFTWIGGEYIGTTAWDKHLDIFRSKVRFPLSAYKKSAGVKILKATLRLVSQAADIAPILSQTTHACGGKLYFLAKPWNLNEGNCLNASGVLIAALPNQTECFIDVTESVNHVCQGGLPNYGFLLTSMVEEMPGGDTSLVDTSSWCVTWYKAYLILEFEQNL